MFHLSQGRTHSDSSCVCTLDSRSVKTREEGAVTHRVTLSEDEGTRLTTSQLRVQPPDLHIHTEHYYNHCLDLHGTSVSVCDLRSYRRPVCGGVADCDLDQSAWFHSSW